MPTRLPLLALLLLASLLLATAGASHVAADPATDPLAFEETFEGEAEEAEGEAESECDTAFEEADEGELGQDEAEAICEEEAEDSRKKTAGRGSVAPEECLLRSVHAHAADNSAHSKLKLTLGYTTYEPANAMIEIRKGSSRIATMRRQLGRSGVLRIVKNLSDGKAPKRLTIRLDIPGSPGYCGKYETEKVRVH